GVRQSIFEALEASAALSECRNHVEQIAGRTGQPVQSGDHQHVAAPDPAEHLGQLGTVGLRATNLLFEHLGASGRHQLGLLGCEVLAVCGNSSVAVSRHFLSPLCRPHAAFLTWPSLYKIRESVTSE